MGTDTNNSVTEQGINKIVIAAAGAVKIVIIQGCYLWWFVVKDDTVTRGHVWGEHWQHGEWWARAAGAIGWSLVSHAINIAPASLVLPIIISPDLPVWRKMGGDDSWKYFVILKIFVLLLCAVVFTGLYIMVHLEYKVFYKWYSGELLWVGSNGS